MTPRRSRPCARTNILHRNGQRNNAERIIWGGVSVVPILGVWDKAADIDFDSLPEKFVLKCNHGSGMNIVVKDKSKLNLPKTRRWLDGWLKVDYAHIGDAFELHYSAIPRKIIAEQFIEEMDGNLHDYKIYCFNGEPKFIQVIGDRNLEKHTGFNMVYDTNWKKTMQLVAINYPPYENDIPRPTVLPQLLEVAKCLSEPFCHVRVDLYVIHDKVYFSEMTFTPFSGIMRFTPPSADKMLGDLLELPKS